MGRGRPLLLFALGLVLVPALGAQIIRGTVEDSTGMPLNDVRVSLMTASSDSVLREIRTGNAGDFSLNAARGGRYRVRLNRIGFAQQTSGIIDLLSTQIVTLRFRMTVVAQQLNAVTVVERRNVTLTELMSASGFDMRQAKDPMHTLSPQELEAEGSVNLGLLLQMQRLPGVEIVEGSLGSVLKMRLAGTGGTMCKPEVYLDGRLLSGTAGLGAEMALARLDMMLVDELYGVEVYTANQIPPPSLGGEFGSVRDSMPMAKPCGVVAVWTKAGREYSLIRERARGEGPVQVVRGKVVDFETGKPVPNASLILRSDFGADLEKPVTADSAGIFAISTKQYQRLRLAASAGGYVDVLTPAFNVELEELLTVEVILSNRHRPAAPIALVSRELARMYSATDIRGFSFRRRRGLAGTFYDATEIARSRARSLAELVRGLPNVTVAGGPDAEAIEFQMAPVPAAAGRNASVTASGSCRPMYFLNGELQREPDATVRSLSLSRLYGVELYPLAGEVPYSYRMGSTGCGSIVVWSTDWVK